jgi:hypothetical protein
MSYRLGRRCVDAECDDCGKRWTAPNAQGVAARHARAHGHTVRVEVVQYIIYGPEKEEVSRLPGEFTGAAV